MRPRKKDRHLPACVYLRGSAYYYVKKNVWTKIGDDLPTALKEYTKKVAAPTERMPGLLARYIEELELAPNTIRAYKFAADKLSPILEEFEPHQLTSRDIEQILYHHRKTPSMANVMRNVLVGALSLAYTLQMVDRNVAKDVAPLPEKKRTRYITDEEYAAIYSKATPTMQVVMDLCYLTGQRIGDVLSIRYADITDEGIHIVQQKTKHRMIVAAGPDLLSVIARAKSLHQSVKGLTLLHTRQGKQFAYSTIRTLWGRACNAAKVEDAHIHDLRAKAATDAKKYGLDSMSLLGHQTESSHRRYQRSRETVVASALSFRSSNKT